MVVSALMLIGFLLLYLIIVYSVFFIISPTVIPNKIPGGMEKAISDLKRKYRDKKQFLKKAFDFVNKRYQSYPLGFFRYPLRMFMTDLNTLWKTTGFQSCVNQNYILKAMLIKSKRFKKSDIKTIPTTGLVFWPHQYLRVKTSNKWIDVDLWGADVGFKWGEHYGI